MKIAWWRSGRELALLAFFVASVPVGQAPNGTPTSPKPTPEIQRMIDAAEKLPPEDRPAELEKVVAIARKSNDHVGEGLAISRIGNAYYVVRQYEKARSSYVRALPIRRRAGDRRGEAGTLGNIGIIDDATGQPGRAIDYYRRALIIRHEIRDLSGEAGLLISIANDYFAIAQYGKALDFYSRTLRIRREIGDRSGQAVTLFNMASLCARIGDFRMALGYSSQCLTIQQGITDRTGEATTLDNMGTFYLSLAEYNQALDSFGRALRVQQDLGDRLGESRTLVYFGDAYRDAADYACALHSYGRSLNIAHETSDRDVEGWSLLGIGNVYFGLAEYSKALEFFNRALKIAREVGDQSKEAAVLCDIGNVYNNLGDYRRALEILNRALPILRAKKERNFEADALSDIGNSYEHSAEYREALVSYRRALAIQQGIGDLSGVGGSLFNIGNVYFDLGEWRSSLNLFFRALSILRSVKHRESESEALYRMASAYRKHGQNRLALIFAKQGINVIQEIRGNIRGLDRSSQRTYRDSVADRFRRLADWLAEDGRLAEAQQVLGLLKDEEYFEFLRRRAGGKSDTVDLTPKEAEWTKQYDALGDRLAADVAEREVLLKISDRTPAQQRRLTDLRAQEDRAGKAFAAFLAGAEAMFAAKGAFAERLHDIQGAIPLQATLKELPGKPAALYTLMTADGVRVIVNIPGLSAPRQAKTKVRVAELNKKILAFREALTDPRVDPRPLGADLYDLIVRPVERDLIGAKIQSLMWSLDGSLRYIPIWALYDRETHQYLIEKYPSSLFTPRTVNYLTRTPRKWTGAEFGVTKGGKVGDVVFKPLPGVARELDGVHSALGGPAPKLDDAFTLAAFRDALDNSPGVVHVATHFHFKPGDEAGSMLLLGHGETLSVQALKEMSETALSGVDLLVLSACETAMGNDADGEEFEGFALLAQLKGAGAVLATLWPVADDSTALLMSEFYRLRKAHPEWTKLGALRQAQLEMLRGQLGGIARPLGIRSAIREENPRGAAPPWPAGLPMYAHPYYWAPFVLTGNWK